MYSYIGKEFKKNLFWKVYSGNVRTILDQTQKEQLEVLLQCPITKTGKWNGLLSLIHVCSLLSMSASTTHLLESVLSPHFETKFCNVISKGYFNNG